MRIPPVAGRDAFPGAKGTAERVRVFKAQQVCGLVQLYDNLYVSNGQLVKETVSGGAYTEQVLANGFQSDGGRGMGVAVDASGNILLADTSANRLIMFPRVGSAYGRPITVSAAEMPYGIGADGDGNVYFTSGGDANAGLWRMSAFDMLRNLGKEKSVENR